LPFTAPTSTNGQRVKEKTWKRFLNLHLNFLRYYKEEKEFEDMMNTRTSDKHCESPEDKLIPPTGKKDKESAK